jgi:uncharacterized protein YjbI with pentapeptide repeats
MRIIKCLEANPIILSKLFVTTFLSAIILISSFGIFNKGSAQSFKSTLKPNPDHVKKLLETRSCPGCDLRNLLLTKETIFGYPLSDNYITNKGFVDSEGRFNKGGGKKVIVVNLRGANLEGASLIGIDLAFSDFRNANLTNSRIVETLLYKADLRGANLKNSTIRNSILICANLQYAKNFSGFKLEDFSKALDLYSSALHSVQGENITGFSGSLACFAKLPDGKLYTESEACQVLSNDKEFFQNLECFGDK